MTKGKIIALAAAIAAIVLFTIYGVHIITADHFPNGSTINGVNVGNMTAPEAEEALTDSANKVVFKCDDKDEQNVDAAFAFNGHDFDKLIKAAAANPFTARKLKAGDYRVDMEVSDGIKETAKAMKACKISKENKKSKNAHIDFEKMKIVKESYGNKLDYKKLAADIADDIEQGHRGSVFVFKSKDYIKPPKVFSTDEALQDEFKFYKRHIGKGLTLVYPDGSTSSITPKALSKIVKYNGGNPEYSEKAAGKLASEHANYHPYSATVKTLKGNQELTNYVLSVPVDQEKAKADILNALQDSQEEVRLEAEGSVSLPDTRIEIDLGSQTCTLVKGGDREFSCDIVSGTSGHRTPTGIYQVAYKAQDVTLRGENDDGSRYASHVDYWMPFNGGIGLHDADWRGAFGGSIYLNNGSHGCVNMPPAYAQRLYNSIDAGTVVVVY